MVADPAIWDELSALLPLHTAVVAEIGPTERVVDAAIEPKLRVALESAGRALLRRRPDPGPTPPGHAALPPKAHAALQALSEAERSLLHRVQRRAHEGFVSGASAWDPHAEARPLAALTQAGLIVPLSGQADPAGPWQLHPQLPPPPPVAYDFDDARMDPPEDLPPSYDSPSLDADIAAMAAALRRHPLRVTHALTPEVAGMKALGRRLADPALARSGRPEQGDPRWRRALDALRLLKVLAVEEISRELSPNAALPGVLALPPAERLDLLVRRALDPALHPLLPPIREALRQANGQAIDAVIFQDLLAQQHRDLLFSPWGQVGIRTYPRVVDDPIVPYTRDSFDDIEGAAIARALHALGRVGMLRLAPGVFAASGEGRQWAGLNPGPRPPIHVTPDLEIVVPPGALSARERYLLEQLAHPLSRDVVDRFALRRADLVRWLEHHTLDEALALLSERAAHGLPSAVAHALRGWAETAERVLWLETA